MKPYFLILFLVFSCAHHQPENNVATDPLPSWNNTEVKKSILNYVTKVTKKGSKDFIPVEDRIATFDNDGTLWSEQPIVQILFAEEQAREKHMKHKPLKEMTKEELVKFFSTTQTGMTSEEYAIQATDFFNEAKHPALKVPLNQTVYKPQVELIRYLTKNNFKVYICSGGTADFMRSISQEYYGIPPEQVIGTTFEYQYIDEKNSVVTKPKIQIMDDKQEKPASIQRVIGKRPVFTSGNVRSGGDIYMLRYSQGGQYPNFQLLINHDDANREFAYQEKDGISLHWAQKYDWEVVSMKKDWKKVFIE